MTAANEAAKDAAPYVHPRLSAIEHTGKDGGRPPGLVGAPQRIDARSKDNWLTIATPRGFYPEDKL